MKVTILYSFEPFSIYFQVKTDLPKVIGFSENSKIPIEILHRTLATEIKVLSCERNNLTCNSIWRTRLHHSSLCVMVRR